MPSPRKELFCPLQGFGMGLNTWETPDNSIRWIWGCLGMLQMHQTLGMLPTEGKEGLGTVSQKVGSCAAIPLSPAPLWRGRQGLSASAPSASGPICTSPSASPSLRPPICSILNPTICRPGGADGKLTLPSGAPHSWLAFWGALPCEKCRILLSPPCHPACPCHGKQLPSLPPETAAAKLYPTSLTQEQRNGGRRKFPAGGGLWGD